VRRLSAHERQPRLGADRLPRQRRGARPRQEFARFIDRVIRYAAGRHRDRYPTSTRRLVLAKQLAAVGRYDEQEQVICLDGPEAKRRLADWLDLDELDLSELAL
jgi:hypothetical protein